MYIIIGQSNNDDQRHQRKKSVDSTLNGKVAVITGGSEGIGLASAQHLAARGAVVFITGRRQSVLDEAALKIPGSVIAIQADASNPTELILSLMSEITGLRLLLVNGLEPLLRGDKITPEQFKEMLRYVKANKRKAAADNRSYRVPALVVRIP